VRWIGNQKGTSLLECALVLPIFIAMVIGFINLALLLNNSLVAKSASRDAANAVAVTGSVSQGLARGNETIETGGLGGKASISVEQPRTGIDRIKSVVTYKVPILAPGLGALLGGKLWDSEVTLQEQTEYYVEYPVRSGYKKPEPKCVGYSCRGGGD
jgi:hypothetical protein